MEIQINPTNMKLKFFKRSNNIKQTKHSNKIILKSIEPDIEQLSQNIIVFQQSPVKMSILNFDNMNHVRNKLLLHLHQQQIESEHTINRDDDILNSKQYETIESGYNTMIDSSRKSSLETEDDITNNNDNDNDNDVNEMNVNCKAHRKAQIVAIKPTNDENSVKYDETIRTKNLVNQLLIDIYGRPYSKIYGCLDSPMLQKLESDCTSIVSANDLDNNEEYEYNCLKQYNIYELQMLMDELNEQMEYAGHVLVRQLKRRDRLSLRRERQYDIITAYLQMYARKYGIGDDTNMRFSMNPSPGDSGYSQWLDAMKMVARLPGGIPAEFRKRLWITLAERHLQNRGVNWSQAERACFNEWSNPDDTELGIQIVKDLHRTGCSLFCGSAGQENQALLKRVLLAYARWNKAVGYCQGFNMLAALILQVMDRSETDAVKVMIYLIEGVLPESYFANNLRGLSVDMAVFRDLLRLRMPNLSRHLDALQNDAYEGSSYEPPLTNVFTMQWFLTLFCNCLPQATVLRVWDLIFLEGNEVLLRTALAIWDGLADRILAVNSADEFYSIMGVLTREMLEFGFMDANQLIKSVVSIQISQELAELRDKYLYNITPWTQTVQSAAKKGFRLFYSDDDELESDTDEKMAVTTAYGIALKKRRDSERRQSGASTIQPYAYGHPDREKLALDISALKQQYAKLRERQRQAHIILTAACARQPINHSPSPAPIAMNHLLLGKSAIISVRGRRLGPPQGAVPPSRHQKSKTQQAVSPITTKDSGETIHWKDMRRDSRRFSTESNKEFGENLDDRSCHSPSSSSSYSDDDDDNDVNNSSSSSSTELCDEPGRSSDFDDIGETGDLATDILSKEGENDLQIKDDIVKSTSESKLLEIKETVDAITHSFSETVLPNLNNIKSDEKKFPSPTEFEDHLEYLSSSTENLNLPQKSYSNKVSPIACDTEALESLTSKKLLSSEDLKTLDNKEKNELSPVYFKDDLNIETSLTVGDTDAIQFLASNKSPSTKNLKVIDNKENIELSPINFSDNESQRKLETPPIICDTNSLQLLASNKSPINKDLKTLDSKEILENIQSPSVTEETIITSPIEYEYEVQKPKFESSRSIDVLRENQTILDNYLKQQELKRKELELSDRAVYSNLYYSENLSSSDINRQSDNNVSVSEYSYDNNVILGDIKKDISLENNKQNLEPTLNNIVLESALSQPSQISYTNSGASTPKDSNFDFAKYLKDRGIDLSPEDILKIQNSPPEKVYDFLEKLSPDFIVSQPIFPEIKPESNTSENEISPIKLKVTTPVESTTKEKENFDFEKFLEERIKYMKQLSFESTSSVKARFDSESDWCKTPSSDNKTEKTVSDSSIPDTTDNSFTYSTQYSLSPNQIQYFSSSSIKETINLENPAEIKTFDEFNINESEISRIYDEDTRMETDRHTFDLLQKRLNYEKQISLDSLNVPEERLETGRRNSEMALKIIQENSMILHRILQYQSKSIEIVEEESIKSKQQTPDEKDPCKSPIHFQSHQSNNDDKIQTNFQTSYFTNSITKQNDDTTFNYKSDSQNSSDNNLNQTSSLKLSLSSQNTPSLLSPEDCSPPLQSLDSPAKISPQKLTYLTHLQFPPLSPSKKKTSPSPITSPDKFNPFPIRPVTRQPKDVGLKLGLYKDVSPLKSPNK